MSSGKSTAGRACRRKLSVSSGEKRRINPAQYDQVEHRRQMIQYKGQGLMDLGFGDHMVVFQDKHASLRQRRECIEERPEQRFQGR